MAADDQEVDAATSGRHVDENTPLLSKSAIATEAVVGEVSESGSKHDDVREAAHPSLSAIFPVLLLGVFLANVIGAVVLATNQHIASEFDALSSAAWLLTIYTLAQCASQPLYGKLCDIFGRRSILACCWMLFVIGDLVVATSSRYGQVLTGRAISGIGSAGMLSMASVIVADLVPVREIAKYRAYINITATTARSFGGPLGAWVAGSFSWRWCFLVPCPLTICGLAFVLYRMPANPSGESDYEEAPQTKEKPSIVTRIDFLGATAIVGFILSFLLLLDQATNGAPAPLTLSLAGASVIFFGLFFFAEKHYASEPILPLGLISKRDVFMPYLIAGCMSASQFTLLYSIPLYFVVVEKTTISRAGTQIAPVVVGNAIGTIVTGRLISRTSRYKLITVCALLTSLFGWALIFLRWTGHIHILESLYVVLPGFGIGTIMSSTFVHLAASLERSEMAIAGTAWFLAQSFGYLFGASCSTALINTFLRQQLDRNLEGFSKHEEIVKSVLSSIENVRKLPEAVQQVVAHAYVTSLHSAYGLSMLFVIIALLLTLLLTEKRMRGK